MSVVKNSSLGPVTRTNPESKPSVAEVTRTADDSPFRNVKRESPRWEPIRKFTHAITKTTADDGQTQDDSKENRDSPAKNRSPDANEQSKRLTQRMRDLYDFKTENEWPKRATNARRGNTWISKSSSEEDRSNQIGRRNSQDLEFNSRVKVIKLKDTKVESDYQDVKRPSNKVDHPSSSDIFNNEYEERLRKFNDRLRYSEDLGIVKPKIKERRTHSDDYDEKVRRSSTKSNRTEGSLRSTREEDSSRSNGKQGTSRGSIRLTRADGSIRSTRSDDSPQNRVRSQAEKKRLSDASTKSKASYAEVNPATPVNRDPRASDASYASVANYSAKRASVDCKSTRKMVELPPRRAFSQTEERSSATVSSVDSKDDRFAMTRLEEMKQKRDSTRYKVYLT